MNRLCCNCKFCCAEYIEPYGYESICIIHHEVVNEYEEMKPDDCNDYVRDE